MTRDDASRADPALAVDKRSEAQPSEAPSRSSPQDVAPQAVTLSASPAEDAGPTRCEALRTMRAESDEALGYLAGKCHHATTVRPILRYIAALTAEHTARLAAEQDTARLDAIERGDVEIECMGTTHHYQWVRGPGGDICANASEEHPKSLREAIDAARRTETPQ